MSLFNGLSADNQGADDRVILLVCTMRNEGPYILEWLAYHLSIGFTDVVICTNDCIDESPLLLDRLHEMGVITHVRSEVPPGEKPQLVAYRKAQELDIGGRADWAMVLDTDEFLNIHVGCGRVTDLLDAVPDATAFLLNWRIFGDSGHAGWSREPVCERFTRASVLQDAVNLSFKTLFTRIDAYWCKLMPHQPRYPRDGRAAELRYVNGAGSPLPAYFHDESRDDFLQSEPDLVSWELAQVNHYNTRSREDYLVKHARGNGIVDGWDLDWNWNAFNKNDETDTTILPKLARARAVMAKLLDDPEVRRRHERCLHLYGAHVTALLEPRRPVVPAGAEG
ncbi:hypothetical protein N825_13855 [Skermanella stibiiresistens SB22]|uniref:Glycosyl transferase family 2 n=1 Tax=Skermanella stibiiresistens SB22 TaxID=1385369 RepID=W9H3E7_9PROT|nr:glycosyltransferase family 2 protein [Skermanella stibiiresistens]EWY38288.1 hypothetical protein N825_13855 [Skermanella stibiiresistens SB22]